MKLVMKLLGETLFATPYFFRSLPSFIPQKLLNLFAKFVRSLLVCTCMSSFLYHDTRAPKDHDKHAHVTNSETGFGPNLQLDININKPSAN